jgi:hypothetical protein
MDGELVLVHFESGCYYSIRGVGADLCQLLSAGWTIREIAESFSAQHGIKDSQVYSDMQTFLDSLISEKLLVPATESRQKQTIPLSATSYSAPCFEKFDDMADQLLLDPIHEIDQSGWPARRAG